MKVDPAKMLLDQREHAERLEGRVTIPEWLLLAAAAEMLQLQAILRDVVEFAPTMDAGNLVAYIETCLGER